MGLLSRKPYLAATFYAVVLCAPAPSYALSIVLTDIGGVGAGTDALAGFTQAAGIWEAAISDNVTVNLNVGFSALGSGILASAGSSNDTFNYASVRSALTTDQSSTDDSSTVANLQAGTGFNMLLNGTSNNPNGPGSLTTYLDNDGDANNTTIRMNFANAKALGLRAANDPATDASITFSSAFNWDFDHTAPITPGFDFVGVAIHEIGHALGFTSGVDILDINTPPANPGGPFPDDLFTFVTPLDLFRFSLTSTAFGVGTFDWSLGNGIKYFSIDGGTSVLGGYATGVNFGDGRQASHWKDGQGFGIMDPTFAAGELGDISALDLRAMDVIGWDLAAAAAVPLPGTFWLLLSGLIGLVRINRKA